MNRRIKKQKSFARLATWPTVPATDSTDVHPFDQIAPDMKHSHYSIEVKSRRSFPAWIENALQQAEAARVDDEQVPLAYISHNWGRGVPRRLYVVLRADAFLYLHSIVDPNKRRSAGGH